VPVATRGRTRTFANHYIHSVLKFSCQCADDSTMENDMPRVPVREILKSRYHRGGAKGTYNRTKSSNVLGAAIVEAAFVLPLFLVTLLGSVNLMRLNVETMRLQYATQTAIRDTFTRPLNDIPGTNIEGRGGAAWCDYFTTRFVGELTKVSLPTIGVPAPTVDTTNNEPTQPTLSADNYAIFMQPGCNGAALPRGQIARVTVFLRRAWLGGSLAGIKLPEVTLRTKATAVVNMDPNE